MKKQDYYYLGKIVSKYSFKGEILLKLASRELINLKPKTIFVEIDESLVPYQIKKVSLHKSMLLRIQFVDVASEYLANQIIKKKTYIHINDLQRLDEKDFYFEEIIGFEIIDSNHGKIGIVQSINSQTPQTLAMVKNIEGNLVIIPLVNAFINDINKKEKQIIVNLPEGLLDLNL